MSKFVTSLFIILLAGCASSPGGAPAPSPASPTTPAARSPNALTPIASMPKPIAEPRIRVGMLSDQQQFVLPRLADGYYIVSDSGAFTIKRGFTDAAPLRNAANVRYAVQAASISDRESAEGMVQKSRTETGQRVDSTFDPSAPNGGMYRILVGD